jgi:hypothetical protein
MRWNLILSEFDFDVKYVKGADQKADMPSRLASGSSEDSSTGTQFDRDGAPADGTANNSSEGASTGTQFDRDSAPADAAASCYGDGARSTAEGGTGAAMMATACTMGASPVPEHCEAGQAIRFGAAVSTWLERRGQGACDAAYRLELAQFDDDWVFAGPQMALDDVPAYKAALETRAARWVDSTSRTLPYDDPASMNLLSPSNVRWKGTLNRCLASTQELCITRHPVVLPGVKVAVGD